MSGAAHISARFRALDGWRGVCALLVAAHHVEIHGFLYRQPLIRNAWLFVDFFFVLSGFVIAHAYAGALHDGAGVKGFVVRRFGRLWPLHAAMLAALVALECVHALIGGDGRPAFADGRSPFAILTNLALVQSLGLHDALTWNGPSWSISTEFYTYLVFATVFALAKVRASRIALSALLALGGWAILATCSRYGMRETVQWGFLRCLYGFFTGVLTYEIWRIAPWKGGTPIEAVLLAAIAAFITFAPGHAALEYLATPLFALAVLVFAAEGGFLSRVLTARPAAALGRWSYSIYMVHTLVLALLFSAVHATSLDLGVWSDPAMLAVLAAVTALAAFTWRVIERPGQRFFRPGPAEIPAQTP